MIDEHARLSETPTSNYDFENIMKPNVKPLIQQKFSYESLMSLNTLTSKV